VSVRAGLSFVLTSLVLAACRVGGADTGDAGPPAAPPPPFAEAATPDDAHTHETTTVAGEPLVVDTFTFSLSEVSLSIADVGATRDLAKTLKSKEDLLTINAGFFDERDAPIGLSRSGKVQLSAFAPKLSGGVLEVDKGAATLFETESYDVSRTPEVAVQCRPRLVVAGKPNVKSDDKKRAERTSVCISRDGKRLAFSVTTNAERGPSLFALGQYLAQRGCRDALALDGGPSTGAIYVGPRGRIELPLRGPIRQAIVVSRRKSP